MEKKVHMGNQRKGFVYLGYIEGKEGTYGVIRGKRGYIEGKEGTYGVIRGKEGIFGVY